jgi:hypothetical protein
MSREACKSNVRKRRRREKERKQITIRLAKCVRVWTIEEKRWVATLEAYIRRVVVGFEADPLASGPVPVLRSHVSPVTRRLLGAE